MNNIEKTVLKKYYDKAFAEDEATALARTTNVYNKYIRPNMFNVEKNKVIARSAFLNADYMFDAIVSSNSINYDGLSIDDSVLQNIPIHSDGDYDHIGLKTGKFNYKGLFKLVKSVYENGKVFLRFILNKNHSEYDSFSKKINNTDSDIKLSAELIGAEVQDNKVINAKEMGWTVLIEDEPANNDATVYARKKK